MDAIQEIPNVVQAGFDTVYHGTEFLYGFVNFLNNLHQVVEQPNRKNADAKDDYGEDDIQDVAGFHRLQVYHTHILLVANIIGGYS